jgi:hypothetical protein
MNRRKELPLSRNDPGTKPHPHRASAWPDCCFADALGPAMQRGGGSKLKGLLRDALRLPSSSPFVHLRIEGLARSARPTTAWSCCPVGLSPRPAAQRANKGWLWLCGFASAMTVHQ